jgi:hypothetical protein
MEEHDLLRTTLTFLPVSVSPPALSEAEGCLRGERLRLEVWQTQRAPRIASPLRRHLH